MVNQVAKIIKKQNKSSETEESNNKLALITTNEHLGPYEEQRRIVFHKKEKTIKDKIFKMHPSLKSNHIYRLFGVSME